MLCVGECVHVIARVRACVYVCIVLSPLLQLRFHGLAVKHKFTPNDKFLYFNRHHTPPRDLQCAHVIPTTQHPLALLAAFRPTMAALRGNLENTLFHHSFKQFTSFKTRTGFGNLRLDSQKVSLCLIPA